MTILCPQAYPSFSSLGRTELEYSDQEALQQYLEHTGQESKLAQINPSLAKRIQQQKSYVSGSEASRPGGDLVTRLKSLHLHELVMMFVVVTSSPVLLFSSSSR